LRRTSETSQRASLRILVLGASIGVVILSLASPSAMGDSSLPDAPTALLGTGSIGAFRWRVLTHHEESPSRKRRPCLEAWSSEVDSPGSSIFTLCASLADRPLPLIKSSGSGQGERTVFAMAYRLSTTRVRIWLQGHRSRLIDLRTLSSKKAQHVGLRPFRYFAFAVAGPFCLLRVISYDGRGNVLDPGHRMPCRR
jgi:hypothetical protein